MTIVETSAPDVRVMFLLGIMLLAFLSLDILMVVSLLRPGDERNQVIVWKASSFTLLAVVLGALGKVVCAVVQSQPLSSNPLIQLEATAILFFLALMYYRKRHGG